MTQNISRLNNASDSIKQGAPKVREGSDYQLVTPSMRLYLPRVEARLRGITAWWFCRKKGHLHTIPCNEQEWDKELAYNCHFTQ